MVLRAFPAEVISEHSWREWRHQQRVGWGVGIGEGKPAGGSTGTDALRQKGSGVGKDAGGGGGQNE